MLTLGIDPGVSGAVAALDLSNRRFSAIETPVFLVNGKRKIDFRQLSQWFRSFDHADFALIENVHAMPKQGVSSTFSFGTAFGAYCMGIASLDVPWQTVEPRVWKKVYGLGNEGEQSRQAASRLLPWASAAWPYKKDHNIAEAALLAHYAHSLYEKLPKVAAA